MYDPIRKVALEKAKITHPIIKKDGMPGKSYRAFFICAACSNEFQLRDVQVDHIKPIGKQPAFPYSPGELEAWVKALFCSIRNLQVLCKACHKQKSWEERQ